MTTPPPMISGHPEKTLTRLLREPALQAFGLALYDGEGQLLASDGVKTTFCSSAENILCSDDCRKKRKNELFGNAGCDTPQLLTCPAGLWHYLLPCQMETDCPCLLIAGGSRGDNINLPYLEDLAHRKGIPAQFLLEYWERLPVQSLQDVLETGRMLQRLLTAPAPLEKTPSPATKSLPDTTDLIKALALAETELIRSTSAADIISAITMALTPHYTARQIALFLPEKDGKELAWLFSEKAPPGSREGALQENADSQITCLPLHNKDELLGCLVLFAPPPSPSDLFLLKILADRIAARLVQLRDVPEPDVTADHPGEIMLLKLKELISIRDLGELCRQILETASQLAEASKGSLMLLDSDAGKLRLQASIGMSDTMADNLYVLPNQGITGLVIGSGQPLLVEDMAKDQRIKISPRPRFRTRSFLSLPLYAQEGLLGVLNLADKRDDDPFCEKHLTLLSTWACYCAPLLERLINNNALHRLKQEAAIDPSTGLYSQAMLERRFAEEVSRCSRSRQELVLLVVEPDRPQQLLPQPSEPKCDQHQAIGVILTNLLRKMDIVTRLASGAFAVILPDTSREGALIIAERLRAKVAEELSSESITISGGLALFPSHGASFAALLQSANSAVEQAQIGGGNTIILAEKTHQNNKIVYL